SQSRPPVAIFTHPAARLVKTIPPLRPPVRINGRVPRDTVGVGHLAPTDVVLVDVYGPLSVLVVPDPFSPNIATIVLSVGFEDNSLQGAARRFVLPFRSFQTNPDTGSLVRDSKVDAFDASSRVIYEGLGAGTKGLDGGSFWFVEDVGEEGAFDRMRWEQDGVGRRALWTVWLFSTPAPVLDYAKDLLLHYPNQTKQLPEWLRENNGFPWRDNYLALATPKRKKGPRALPSPPTERVIEAENVTVQNVAPKEETTSKLARPIPPVPSKPHHLRARSARREASLARAATAPPIDYRNSLVAVDNETGQIIAVLASDVALDGANGTVEHDNDEDDEDELEVQTPLDEDLLLLSVAQEKPLPDMIELPEEAVSALDNTPLATPRQSTIIHRPVTVYRDADADRPNSRPPSMLAADTFAPPPLPAKSIVAATPADCETEDRGTESPSRRTSTASAAFFSAESDAGDEQAVDHDEHEDDDCQDDRETRRALLADFISIDGGHSKDVEMHRPELLRDLCRHDDENDDDARSDISGSTIGGPAVKLWRKARGKPKKKIVKAAQEPALGGDVRGHASRQASQMSDRTSKAETALESFQEDDLCDREAEQTQDTETEQEKEESHESVPAQLPPSRIGYHCSRSAMCTEDIRSIEDRVWREALESGDLPIDAPYTHLAASRAGRAASYRSSSRWSDSGSAIELVPPTDGIAPLHQDSSTLALREGLAAGRKRKNVGYMQGGTVLVEFLAGTSRFGASIIRGTGLESVLEHPSDSPAAIASAEQATEASSTAGRMLGLVPLLPQHLMSLLGLATSRETEASPSAVSLKGSVEAPAMATKITIAPSPANSYLSNLALGSVGSLIGGATGWVSNLFSFSPSSSSPFDQNRQLRAEVDDEEDDEWEIAIPDFDPNSLASTPRPVYRRKRPIPSSFNGFNVRSTGEANKAAAVAARRKPEPQADVETKVPADKSTQRYSILHIDSLGIGRRAFLKGLP
ncbi:hypothetical protein BCV70DRAFT_147947, partial [Testicularia cyperi]